MQKLIQKCKLQLQGKEEKTKLSLSLNSLNEHELGPRPKPGNGARSNIGRITMLAIPLLITGLKMISFGRFVTLTQFLARIMACISWERVKLFEASEIEMRAGPEKIFGLAIPRKVETKGNFISAFVK